MKKILLGGLAWVLVFQSLCAQTTDYKESTGIYLTLQDYLHRRLTHAFVNKTKGFHLRMPWQTRLKLITPDSTYFYKLEDIFGYRDNGLDWCYRNGELLEILGYKALYPHEQKGLWLYRRHEWSEYDQNYTYFFSKDATGELIWFSYKKLHETYRDDKQFMSLVSKVRRKRLLDSSGRSGQPLLLDIYETSHQLHFSLKEMDEY